MARPKKQTVDYYPHMAKSGKTIFILESHWGNDGYAFFFKLLETLCSTDGHVIDYGNPAEREFLLAKTRVTDETATGILDKLAELGKIDQDLWGERRIWYQNLVDNIKDAYKKRIDELPQKPSLRHPKQPATEFPAPETPSQPISTVGSTESKVKESKEEYIPPIAPQEQNDLFSRFWSAYPKKKSKGQAEKTWAKLKVDEQLLATMLAKIELAKKSTDWLKESGQYIPYPSTWLSAKGWEDEYLPANNQSPAAPSAPQYQPAALKAWGELSANIGRLNYRWSDPDILEAARMIGGTGLIGQSPPGSMKNAYINAFVSIKQRKSK